MKITPSNAASTRNAGGILLATLSLSLVLTAKAQNYLGAAAVLREVAQQNSQTDTLKPDTNSVAAFRDALKVFRNTVTNLSPSDAANGWLELVDRSKETHPVSNPSFGFNRFAQSVSAIAGQMIVNSMTGE